MDDLLNKALEGLDTDEIVVPLKRKKVADDDKDVKKSKAKDKDKEDNAETQEVKEGGDEEAKDGDKSWNWAPRPGQQQQYGGYNGYNRGFQRPPYNSYQQGGGGQRPPYNNYQQGGGFQRPPYNNYQQGGGFQRPPYNNYQQGGGFQRPPYNNNGGGGFQRRYY